jgi:hypothetical protein
MLRTFGRSLAVAGVLTVVGGLGLAATPAKAQGFGVGVATPGFSLSVGGRGYGYPGGYAYPGGYVYPGGYTYLPPVVPYYSAPRYTVVRPVPIVPMVSGYRGRGPVYGYRHHR